MKTAKETHPNVTRGNGLLEGYLARRRAAKANRLIPEPLRKGRVLDIGCGSFPLFLAELDFCERYGLDKGISRDPANELGQTHDLTLIDMDIGSSPRLPFADDFFDVVTMLAVIEHLEPARAGIVVREIRRVLKPNGVFIATTPARWTKGLLVLLARLGMVSAVEIEDHKAAYSRRQILSLLESAGFSGPSVRSGYFETFMNMWLKATKIPLFL